MVEGPAAPGTGVRADRVRAGLADRGPGQGLAEFAFGLDGDAVLKGLKGGDVLVKRRRFNTDPFGQQTHGQAGEADLVGERRPSRDDRGRSEASPSHERSPAGRAAAGTPPRGG